MPRDHAGLIARIISEGTSKRVVEAFERVDRAGFVPVDARRAAYRDRPIPILEQQTTSQPSLVARMLDAAEISTTDRVLEVGTGFGYQTALLAHLAGHVVSIDRHAALVTQARANLQAAGVTNATVVVGDGWDGWPPDGPYDAIVVSAAAASLPAAFGEQLTDGGRLVIPLAERRADDVYLFRKMSGALVRERLLTPARFVPLVRGTPGTQNR